MQGLDNIANGQLYRLRKELAASAGSARDGDEGRGRGRGLEPGRGRGSGRGELGGRGGHARSHSSATPGGSSRGGPRDQTPRGRGRTIE